MSPSELEKDSFYRRSAIEGREKVVESQESKEEKKMGARERVEKFSREVQNTQNQIQHILTNMQQVVKAVQAIRGQLGLGVGQIPSVGQDQKTLEKLRKKLLALNSEMNDLKIALVQEEEKSIKEENPDWNSEVVTEEAEKRAQEILKKLGF